MNILVFTEHHNHQIKKSSLELICKAQELALPLGGTVCAVLVGNKLDQTAQELTQYSISKIFLIENPLLESYNTLAYTEILESVIKNNSIQVVLGTASPVGKDLFPRLSAKIKAGLVTEATELKIENNKLVAKKPVYSGKALVTVEFNTPIQMALARPNSFLFSEKDIKDQSDKKGQTEILKLNTTVTALQNPLWQTIQENSAQQKDVSEAEIIVAGGRGMLSLENFKILRELAAVLGASVGASRAAVDSGFATHDMQIGQTGKTVSPNLFIACGISGAIQHFAGMRTSKTIVAINKDPEAPIFSKADYGIVGDLFEIVPLLTKELNK